MSKSILSDHLKSELDKTMQVIATDVQEMCHSQGQRMKASDLAEMSFIGIDMYGDSDAQKELDEMIDIHGHEEVFKEVTKIARELI